MLPVLHLSVICELYFLQKALSDTLVKSKEIYFHIIRF